MKIEAQTTLHKKKALEKQRFLCVFKKQNCLFGINLSDPFRVANIHSKVNIHCNCHKFSCKRLNMLWNRLGQSAKQLAQMIKNNNFHTWSVFIIHKCSIHIYLNYSKARMSSKLIRTHHHRREQKRVQPSQSSLTLLNLSG